MSHADIPRQIAELWDRAGDLEHGPMKVALHEQAVRLADTYRDTHTGWECRRELIEAAIFGEEPEKAIAPLAWSLAACDREPEEFDEAELFWPFKWVVNNAKKIVQVPMPALVGMIDDMEKRFVRQGATLRAVWNARWSLDRFRGLKAEARRNYALWDATPRDEYADCRACEQDDRVDFLAFDGRLEEAVEAAGPILSGRMKCAEIPKNTYNRVMLPLVKLGRVDEAMAVHRKGHRLISGKPMLVEDAAHHITFLALTDNLARAIKLFETHLPYPREALASGRMDRFDFALAARFLMERVASSRDANATVALRLPKAFPVFQESGRYDPLALASFFDDEARKLAALFDARNETGEFARRCAEARTLPDLVSPYPIKPTGPE